MIQGEGAWHLLAAKAGSCVHACACVAAGALSRYQVALLNTACARRRTSFLPLQVRHPGVGTLMERDFTLMRRGAQLLAALPLVGTPQVKESVMQASGVSVLRQVAAGNWCACVL